jgi:hypothetical protein
MDTNVPGIVENIREPRNWSRPMASRGRFTRGRGKNSGFRIMRQPRESQAPEKEIKALARRIQKETSELKFWTVIDNTYSAISYNGTDFFQALTLVPQGDTDSSRDGDRLYLHEIRMRMNVKINTTTPVFFRVIIFQWFPNTVPQYNSILIDQHNTANAATSDYQHDTRQMFNILYDKLVTLDTVAIPAVSIDVSLEKGFRKKIQFATATTVGTNHVYVLAVSDVLAGGPQNIMFVKTTYYDG